MIFLFLLLLLLIFILQFGFIVLYCIFFNILLILFCSLMEKGENEEGYFVLVCFLLASFFVSVCSLSFKAFQAAKTYFQMLFLNSLIPRLIFHHRFSFLSLLPPAPTFSRFPLAQPLFLLFAFSYTGSPSTARRHSKEGVSHSHSYDCKTTPAEKTDPQERSC